MANQNGARAATINRDPRLLEVLLGGGNTSEVSPSPQKKQATRRRAARSAASIYHGRELLGRVEPIGTNYRAINADGEIIGTFGRFNDAVTAINLWGRR